MLDQYGNVVPAAGRSVAMALATGTGILGGTTVRQTNASGVATFDDLSVNLVGTKQLSATSGALASATSIPFDVFTSAAYRITIQTQPSASAVAGIQFARQPVIRVEDINGNLVSTDTSTVLAAARATGLGSLGGTVSRKAHNGIVHFTDILHTVANTITIAFTSSGLQSALSDSVVVSPGAASRLTFVQEPSDAAAGAAITPPVTVRLKDAFDNNVTSSTVPVTVSLISGTGTLSGTLVRYHP